jgi:predicted ester cyclase
LPEVYDGTIESDRGLRDIIISTFRRFPDLAQKHDVEEVVKETPALAWELFRVAWGLPV